MPARATRSTKPSSAKRETPVVEKTGGNGLDTGFKLSDLSFWYVGYSNVKWSIKGKDALFICSNDDYGVRLDVIEEQMEEWYTPEAAREAALKIARKIDREQGTDSTGEGLERKRKRAKREKVKREEEMDGGSPIGEEEDMEDETEEQVERQVKEEPTEESEITPRPSRSRSTKKQPVPEPITKLEPTKPEPDPELDPTSSTPTSASKKKPSNKYNLTPGETPFPSHPHPTREECQNVIDLLSTVHERPERTKIPSVTMPGCGEVPAVLDSLMRTMLSAATTSANSSRAFQGIVEKYGLLETGEGKGSVDWNKVRLGTREELFKTIQCGGLAQNKSKNMKAILDMVYEENQTRLAQFTSPSLPDPAGAANESSTEKRTEITTAQSEILSLNHLHSLSTSAAMEKLTSYPGIGVKTASCVLLFNFERGSFAVDTHVWRLCRWLNWVPQGATRNQTFSHCDTRIPDEMKYDLHGLFWKHGKYCPKCRMMPVKGRPDLDNMVCPIDDLIKAAGGRRAPMEKKRAAGSGTGVKGKAKAKARGKGKRKREESEESELSDLTDSEDE